MTGVTFYIDEKFGQIFFNIGTVGLCHSFFELSTDPVQFATYA